MYEKPDPSKLRNSTLVAGVILMATSFAQVTLDTSKPISFLGLPLIIQNQSLISYSLIGISLYYLFRYWFYSMRIRSTWHARSAIFSELTRTDDRFLMELATRDDVIDRLARIVHSGIKFDDVGSYLKDKKWELWIINPRKYSFTTFLRDIDFAAPAILNIVAIVIAVLNVV